MGMNGRLSEVLSLVAERKASPPQLPLMRHVTRHCSGPASRSTVAANSQATDADLCILETKSEARPHDEETTVPSKPTSARTASRPIRRVSQRDVVKTEVSSREFPVTAPPATNLVVKPPMLPPKPPTPA